MNIEGISRNFEGLNVAPSSSRVYGDAGRKNDMDTFSTVEWKNKNDGKTYVAKKLTLTENDKEITGVYVFEKDSKPDENGNITGEFMSFDSFMQKMADELPAVNSSTAKAYFPNIQSRGTNLQSPVSQDEVDESAPLEVGFEFEENFNSSLKLSDGSMILRPLLQGSIRNIKKDDVNGNYYLVYKPVVEGSEFKEIKITEEEILNNKSLCAGTIKKVGDDQYEVTYYTGVNYNNMDKKTVVMDSISCGLFMDESSLSTYPVE